MSPLDDTVRIGKALADRTRARIVVALGVRELCVCELTDLLAIRQSVVSRHLGVLRNAGLVEDVRDGKFVNYRLRHDGSPLARAVLRTLSEPHEGASELRDLRRRAKTVDRRKILACAPKR